MLYNTPRDHEPVGCVQSVILQRFDASVQLQRTAVAIGPHAPPGDHTQLVLGHHVYRAVVMTVPPWVVPIACRQRSFDRLWRHVIGRKPSMFTSHPVGSRTIWPPLSTRWCYLIRSLTLQAARVVTGCQAAVSRMRRVGGRPEHGGVLMRSLRGIVIPLLLPLQRGWSVHCLLIVVLGLAEAADADAGDDDDDGGSVSQEKIQ